MNKLELMKMANNIRKDIVTAVHSAKAGHPGGSLSAADLYTYLYFVGLNVDPKDPKKADRDRFVLSKGHTAPGYYAALAERGFFPVEDLKTLRHTGSYLQGHPDMKHIPGVDMSTGSLGQGISAAVGMAIAGKLDNKNYKVVEAEHMIENVASGLSTVWLYLFLIDNVLKESELEIKDIQKLPNKVSAFSGLIVLGIVLLLGIVIVLVVLNSDSLFSIWLSLPLHYEKDSIIMDGFDDCAHWQSTVGLSDATPCAQTRSAWGLAYYTERSGLAQDQGA